MAIDTGGKPFGEPILRIGKGEKIYKVYRFFPLQDPGYYFEYRILTKVRKDGDLDMASYWFRIVEGQKEKGGITRSEKIPPHKMEAVVRGMKRRVDSISPSRLEVMDLTKYGSIEEQVEQLQKLDQVDTQYLD